MKWVYSFLFFLFLAIGFYNIVMRYQDSFVKYRFFGNSYLQIKEIANGVKTDPIKIWANPRYIPENTIKKTYISVFELNGKKIFESKLSEYIDFNNIYSFKECFFVIFRTDIAQELICFDFKNGRRKINYMGKFKNVFFDDYLKEYNVITSTNIFVYDKGFNLIKEKELQLDIDYQVDDVYNAIFLVTKNWRYFYYDFKQLIPINKENISIFGIKGSDILFTKRFDNHLRLYNSMFDKTIELGEFSGFDHDLYWDKTENVLYKYNLLKNNIVQIIVLGENGNENNKDNIELAK